MSETREGDDIDGEPMDSDAAPPPARSRALSTVTCVSDLPVDIDMPLPPAAEPQAAASSSSSSAQASQSKRRHEGPEGDADRGDRDPAEPEDMEAGCAEIYMLGERKWKQSRVRGELHSGLYDVCELFSPPRVSEMATRQGLRGGWALDINCEDPVTKSKWDLSEEKTQAKVWKLIRRDKPLVIGMSPECTLFSALQNLRKTEIPPDELARAKNCVRFCVEVAKYQRSKGRFFYLEHPLTASSWRMPELAELRDAEDVYDVVLHACRFDLKSTDDIGEGLVKKPTRVITNMGTIAGMIDRQCTGDHRHVHLVSGKAKAAAEYTEEFCKAIVAGVDMYLERGDEILLELSGEYFDEMEPEEMIPFHFDGWGRCVDDVSGADLPMDLVKKGRAAEIQCFSDRKVYTIRPRAEAKSKGAKVLGVRWVDIWKNGKVRSRLVCQDFNPAKGKKCDEMFAATPPLVVSRWLTSLAASQGAHGPGKKQLMALDFSKAFLYGDVQREIYVELPDEDGRKLSGDFVGLLSKSMYGLRDAPQVWQGVVETMLLECGFKKILCTQCTYYQPDWDMYVVAHVDDFLILGERECMDKFVGGLQSDGYECTCDILGNRSDEVKSLKFLGRQIHLREDGIEWEGDSRHAEAYLTKLAAAFSSGSLEVTSGMRAVNTPGVKRPDEEFAENGIEQQLDKEASRAYRGLAALANFMAQDGPDIGFATKEISKAMASPCEGDVPQLKRLGRYLIKYPRRGYLYRWQTQPKVLSGYSDSDWGGDRGSRRSTSGGCLMAGMHLLTQWSRTQHVISLSSAEAELHALCTCATEGLALRNICVEMGLEVYFELLTDSSAAKGIVMRQGAGKVKHLDIKSLWIQERESVGDLKVLKVPRLENWSI